jgi:hypothetical protein
MPVLDEVLQFPQRKLVVCQNDLSLDGKDSNTVFVLMVEESRGSAGGRAAGSGSRRIDRVYGFACTDGRSSRIFETDKESDIELFDIPYSAVAMDIKLSDGRPYVVQGVVDPELVSRYLQATSNLK